MYEVDQSVSNHDDLVVRGYCSSTLVRRARKGLICRIARGLYTVCQPTPEQLAAIVLDKFPKVALDGRSAKEVYQGTPLTFPLVLVTSSTLPASPLWTYRRSRKAQIIQRNGFRITAPLWAASAIADEDEALDLVETTFEGRYGYQKLQDELNRSNRLSSRALGLIKRAAIAADSPPERVLVRALKAVGLQVRSNIRLGNYTFDIDIVGHKVCIEVDGYRYHHANRKDVFTADRWKNNEATVAGYTALRYTASCIRYHLDHVVAQILGVCGGPKYFPPPVGMWHRMCIDSEIEETESQWSRAEIARGRAGAAVRSRANR